MTMGFSTAVRNAMLDAITTQAGASALLNIYSGTRPATGGALSGNTLLAQLTCNATFAPASSGGVLTLNSIANATAAATGTATWARLTTSGGTFVADFGVGTSGTEIIIGTTSITSGATVSVSSATITAGNA
ncbi:hypothetical protein AQ733_09985 [Burkholderia pseudomallei]|nr:hypothetical protein AQ733_09985 [Burkholderia pseudomallei]OMS09914.1 hypothetical protein AQ735_08385 [Burkholderia pseudomallei]CAJ2881802.1 Uncharacterised protein [Burkholderia pseudomallei]CAJ7357009.1 Uncharacterised protein [Burkholderia pseudomallei]CAJ8905520.1 Uncharacterised protein [Burkholderia pseudomallei]